MFAQSEYIKLSGSRRPARVLRLMAVGRRRSINANPTHWHVIGSFNDRVKEGILSPNTIGIVAYTSVVTLTVTRGSSIPQFLGPSTRFSGVRVNCQGGDGIGQKWSFGNLATNVEVSHQILYIIFTGANGSTQEIHPTDYHLYPPYPTWFGTYRRGHTIPRFSFRDPKRHCIVNVWW